MLKADNEYVFWISQNISEYSRKGIFYILSLFQNEYSLQIF